MADINEIISQEAVDGLLQAAKAAQTLDSAVSNIIKSQVSFAEKTKALSGAQAESEKITKEQAKVLADLDKQRQKAYQTMAKQEAAEREMNEIINKEAQSISEVNRQTAALKKQRDSLNKSTADYSKQVAEINNRINQNNKFVKENSSALEKQKMNVGNYTNSIKAALGSMGPFGQTILNISNNFNTFATAVKGGAIAQKAAAVSTGLFSGALRILKIALISSGVGVLVVALGSLIAYFTSTERGADKLQKMIAGFKAIIAVVGDRFKIFGEALSLLFTGQFEAASEKFKETFSEIGKEIKEEYGTARKLAEEFDRISDARRNEMVILEERKLRATELLEVAKSEENTLKEKLAAYYEANNLLKLNRDFVNSLNESEKAALIEQASIRDLSEDDQMANQQRLSELAREQKEAQSEVNSLLKLGNKLKKQSAEEVAVMDAAAADRALTITEMNGLGIQQIELDIHAKTLEMKEQMDINFIDSEDERLRIKHEKQLQAAQEYVSKYAAIGQTLLDFNQFLIDTETAKMEQAKAYELQMAGDNAEKRAKIDAKYEKEAAKLKAKQAKHDKAMALFSATINMARAIIIAATAGPGIGLVLAAITAAFAAVQVAVIASAPIPQFAKGTKNARRGLAWVGERGRELMIGKDGQLMMTPGTATMMSLKGGERIISNPETELLMRAAKGADDGYSKRLLDQMHSDNLKLIETVKNKPVIHIDRKGTRINERNGDYFRTYLNRKLG